MIRGIVVALAASLLAGCGQFGVIIAGPVSPASGPAVSVLAGLPVKGRAPTTGYRRDQFGQRWRDIDRNGCDQRNDVLARDLTGPVFKPGTRNCLVLSGTLHDPYTDRRDRLPARGGDQRRRPDRPRRRAVQRLADRGPAARRSDPGTVGQRSAEPAGHRGRDQPVQGRRRRGDLAAAGPGFPLRLRGPAGGGEGQVRAVGHRGRARRDHRVLAGCPGQPLPAGLSSRPGGASAARVVGAHWLSTESGGRQPAPIRSHAGVSGSSRGPGRPAGTSVATGSA